jgi:hypothetical protein
MGFNFVIVFSPGVLESAPHSFMATLSLPEAQERPFARAVSRAFPTISAIRVKEVVETVSGMLGQLSVAVRSAASVAILAGIAVLVGALAASRRARVYDSVILKLLGATRSRILAAQALEFTRPRPDRQRCRLCARRPVRLVCRGQGAGAGMGAGLGHRRRNARRWSGRHSAAWSGRISARACSESG